MTGSPPGSGQAQGKDGAGWKRWLPLLGLLALTVAVFALGGHKYLTFKTIGLNFTALRGIVSEHLALTLAAFVGIYIAVVALSLPGGFVMTLSGGLLFGWKLAVPATVVAAAIGATLVYLIARSSLGAALAERAGPRVEALREGFQANAMSYLVFLRLVPLFPFVLVNLAAAILGVPLATYVVATFFGIIPATAAFSIAGSGLGSVVEAQNAAYAACLAAHGGSDQACPYTIDTGKLVTPELLLAFAAVGVVALIPVILKPFARKRGVRTGSPTDAS